MLIKESDYDEAGAEELRVLGQSWGDMSEDLRHRWCLMQLDFPPVWLGTAPMVGTSNALRAGGYSSISWWVGVAREFDAAGFSPEMYEILRLCIRGDYERWEKHPLIHFADLNRPREFIRAAEWVQWLALVKQGHTPLGATWVVMEGAVA